MNDILVHIRFGAYGKRLAHSFQARSIHCLHRRPPRIGADVAVALRHPHRRGRRPAHYARDHRQRLAVLKQASDRGGRKAITE